MTNRSMLKGAIALSVASVLAKIIGALYKIPLAGVIGAEGMGLYQSVFPVYALTVALTSGGLTTAVAGVVAGLSKREGELEAGLLKSCLIVFCLISLAPACAIALLCGFISSLQASPQSYAGYLLISPAVVFATASAVLRGYFQGKHNFTPSALTQLVEQVVKLSVGLPLCLIFAKNNAYLGFIFAISAVTLSEIAALTCFLPFFKRYKLRLPFKSRTPRAQLKAIFYRAMPLTLSTLILPACQLIESVIVLRALSRFGSPEYATSQYGLMSGIVGALLSLPTAVACSASSVFLPKISQCRGERARVEGYFSLAVRVFTLGGLLSSCALFIFADSIVGILFSQGLTAAQASTAARLLRLGSAQVFYSGVLHATAATLQGVGRAGTHAITLAVSGLVKTLTCLVLTYRIGIEGAMLSSVIFYATACLTQAFILLFRHKLSADLSFLPNALISTAAFALTSAALTALTPFSSGVGSVLAGVIALTLYACTQAIPYLISKGKQKNTV